MSGKARDKVVTSGRLTGKVKVSRLRGPGENHPGILVPRPITMTVTTLHRGLDKCAALLSGILMADEAASAGLQRTPKKVTSKPRSSSFQGKKPGKKFPAKAGTPALLRIVKGGAIKSRGSTSQGKASEKKPAIKSADAQSSERCQPAAAHSFTPPAPHSGVKLHPPQKPTLPVQSLSAGCQTSAHQSASVPPSQRSGAVLRDQNHSCSASAACDGKDECVPMGDADGAAGCILTEGCCREEMLHSLLEEVRALIAGQDNQNPELCRYAIISLHALLTHGFRHTSTLKCVCFRVKNWHKKVEEPQKCEILISSEEPSLEQEVISAQSSLQQLQDDLTELREALQDTRSRLRDTEAEKALIKTELEAARNLLLESEREKIELESVAQLRLKEIKLLRRLLQSHCSSKPMDVQNSLSLTKQYFGQQNQVVASTDRIKEYLTSLNQGEPPYTESLHVAAEREETSKVSGTNQREQCVKTLPRHQDHHHHPSLSVSEDVPPCEVESVWSNWSIKSESTFNTRDEAAFRDGLAALDASIANLQKTIQLDLRK
ncbi:uncharacterized protein ccdc14 isoform X2 [Poecilia reticulata]|uniref:uncharacterized protein ccdc14 isoform X2 n=1 Tax=Poecilia reticulata TaxID=8081 RepID=UPI0004A345B0|nr:PREDICTED: coiled-coil domain-containing protein 14 isoform X2 [Poecilia reticulata]